MTFNEYCIENNIQMQPQDTLFLKKQLKTIPAAFHKVVVRQYTEIWVSTRDATERSVAATNAARFAANTWIRTEGQGFRG